LRTRRLSRAAYHEQPAKLVNMTRSWPRCWLTRKDDFGLRPCSPDMLGHRECSINRPPNRVIFGLGGAKASQTRRRVPGGHKSNRETRGERKIFRAANRMSDLGCLPAHRSRLWCNRHRTSSEAGAIERARRHRAGAISAALAANELRHPQSAQSLVDASGHRLLWAGWSLRAPVPRTADAHSNKRSKGDGAPDRVSLPGRCGPRACRWAAGRWLRPCHRSVIRAGLWDLSRRYRLRSRYGTQNAQFRRPRASITPVSGSAATVEPSIAEAVLADRNGGPITGRLHDIQKGLPDLRGRQKAAPFGCTKHRWPNSRHLLR